MRDEDTCPWRPCKGTDCAEFGDEKCLRDHEAIWLEAAKDEAADAIIDMRAVGDA